MPKNNPLSIKIVKLSYYVCIIRQKSTLNVSYAFHLFIHKGDPLKKKLVSYITLKRTVHHSYLLSSRVLCIYPCTKVIISLQGVFSDKNWLSLPLACDDLPVFTPFLPYRCFCAHIVVLLEQRPKTKRDFTLFYKNRPATHSRNGFLTYEMDFATHSWNGFLTYEMDSSAGALIPLVRQLKQSIKLRTSNQTQYNNNHTVETVIYVEIQC